MANPISGLTEDALFVGATRPPMRWGVTYAALLLNLVSTLELFLVSQNLLMLLIAVPIHGVCVLLCARDPRVFDLLKLGARTRLPQYFGNFWCWRSTTYTALVLDIPNLKGKRRTEPSLSIAHGSGALR